MSYREQQFRVPRYAIADGTAFGTEKLQDTRVQQVYLLCRTSTEQTHLESFVIHPDPKNYDGKKSPKWLERGTHTLWDSETKTGMLTAHNYSVPVALVSSEQKLHQHLARSGKNPQEVLVLTASESGSEIILSPKNLPPQDVSLFEQGYNIATIGGMKKTDEPLFASFRNAWGFLVGQAAYFQETSSSNRWNGEAKNGENHALSKNWFREHKRNPKKRSVPGPDGTIHTLSDFEFFNTPDDPMINHINTILEKTKASGTRPVLYIPTCPPDYYTWAGGNTIEYSKTQPLQDGIAWTTENTLDALEQLLPELARADIAPEIVFGIGDYEHSLGYTRNGMTPENFRDMINRSQTHITKRIQAIIQSAYGRELESNLLERPLAQGVNEVLLTGDNSLPQVRITGMMELAGGENLWRLRFAKAQEEGPTFFTSRYGRLANQTLSSRQKMVDHWLQMKGQEITDENRIQEFSTSDLPSYLAFHTMIRELWPDRCIVIAGDSRPMEQFAATVRNNALITVSGLYDGADYK